MKYSKVESISYFVDQIQILNRTKPTNRMDTTHFEKTDLWSNRTRIKHYNEHIKEI